MKIFLDCVLKPVIAVSVTMMTLGAYGWIYNKVIYKDKYTPL